MLVYLSEINNRNERETIGLLFVLIHGKEKKSPLTVVKNPKNEVNLW